MSDLGGSFLLHIRPKAAIIVATALAVTLAAAGCSSSTPAPKSPKTPSASTPRAESTPTLAADVVLPGSWETFDRVLISDAVFQNYAVSGVLKSGTTNVPVYVPGNGAHTVPLKADVGVGEVQMQTVNVGGADGSLMLIVETATRLPAHGLEKAASHNQLDSYDIATGKHIATYMFPDSNSEGLIFNLIAATRGDDVAVDSAGSNVDRQIVGVNVRTGQRIWDQNTLPIFKTRYLSASSYGTFATTSETGGKSGLSACVRVDGFDTATGSMLWSDDAATIPDKGSTLGECSSIGVKPRDQATTGRQGNDFTGMYLEVGLGMSHGLGADPTEYRIYDGVSGEQLASEDITGRLDLVSGYIASQPFVTSYGPVTVKNISTGKTVYSVDQAKVDDLSLELVGIFGGWLYTKTTDGSPVIDVATGKVIADNTSNIPRQTVGKYTLYTDGTLSLNPHLGSTGGTPAPTDSSTPG
jgi:hypothetical protein